MLASFRKLGARTLSAATAAAPGQTQLPIADQFRVVVVLNMATYNTLSSLQMFV